MRLLLLVAGVASVAAQWIGMSPNTADATKIELFLLQGAGVRGSAIGTVSISSTESVDIDAFRCRPLGTFCVFSTRTNANVSYLYNVSASDASVISQTRIDEGIIHNLSVDMATGGVFTIVLSNRSAVVSMIMLGKVEPLVDLSSYMCAGCYIPVGSMTQCSNDDSMWVQIRSATGAQLVAMSLTTRTILGVINMKQPVASLWASCNDKTKINAVGGAAIINSGTQIAYGRILNDGSFTADSVAAIPAKQPPLVLSGLLSEPMGYAFFMALYPAGTGPGSNSAGVFAFGNFGAGQPLKLVATDYYLTGAARVT